MTSAHTVAAFVGIVLSFSIIFLVRRDHISPNVAARWFLVSLCVLGLGLKPEFIDYIGAGLGIGYPPIIPVLLAIAAALVKILLMDIAHQKQQVKLDRLIQKVSIMEAENVKLRNDLKIENGRMHNVAQLKRTVNKN